MSYTPFLLHKSAALSFYTDGGGSLPYVKIDSRHLHIFAFTGSHGA